jgi:integrase
MKRINGTPRTPHIVPLARQAVEILRALQQLTGGSEFLFPGEQGNTCMSNNTILAAMENMGYKGRMTGHGFRGIASTVLHEHQFPHEHIELQMAHMKRDKVSAAYDYAKHLEPRAKMMQWYADYLDRVKQGAKVISIDIAS